MANDLIDRISQSLNEEKWTRATLNSYTIANFEELDEMIGETEEKELTEEVKELCDEHLGHTKNSIIALYISGILALKRQMIDDTNMVILIDIFRGNHKWNIVEFLCNRILSFGENKYALRTLAESYNNDNQQEKLLDVWERLIRVDYEEADIVQRLAAIKEENGDLDNAIGYYKKAIHRYISKKRFSNVRDIWEKLLELAPQDVDTFFLLERKVAKTINEDKAVQLLEVFYPLYKNQEDWDVSIEILKEIFQYDPQNSWARKEIVECYRNKYADHSQLEDYIRISNITQEWRNINEAVSDFEKHISFDSGNFVFHRSWGVGRIRSIDDDDIVIDFVRKRGHSMSLKMAVNSLVSLEKNHIWVLKSVWPKEKLKNRMKSDVPWALQLLIRSYGNVADMKKIKNELVPGVLTQGEWSTWSQEARRVLKESANFGTLPDKADQFTVRERPISFEEKLFNRFKAEKNFFDRMETFIEFYENDKTDSDSEFFNEMYSFFTAFVKSYTVVNEFVLCSFLLVDRVSSDYAYLNPGLGYGFKELFEQIDDLESLFNNIENKEMKKTFLQKVKQEVVGWPVVYTRLFPLYLSKFIIDELASSQEWDVLSALVQRLIDHYREYKEAFVWMARNLTDEDWFKELGISYERILISMIHLLDITYREISNRRDVSNNRRINKQILTFLVKEGTLENFILQSDQDTITRVFSLVQDVKDLDPKVVNNLKNRILEKYPKFHFIGEEKDKDRDIEKAPRGILCLRSSLSSKQRELQNIVEVEIPKNSKEIGAAIELGDLSENAEYKAGKERQEYLNNAANKLKEEIDKAQPISPENVRADKVGYGIRLELLNQDSGDKETYDIMGPWESEPSKNIISYLSPLGNKLMGSKKGDELSFEINERNYHYHVESLEVSPLIKQ